MLTIEKISDNELKLTGRFDASQEKKAADQMAQFTESITLDFSDLHYISSMGLSVLVTTYKRLDAEGHSITLKNLSSHVRDVFQYTKLDQLFIIE
jgi:anti-anti-sigma factor